MDNDTMTIDKLHEAMELIKALSPPEAPKDAIMVQGHTGLRIMKNEMLPADTIVVSKDLFDMIYPHKTQE